MSISSIVRKAGPFAGNGVQTVFPFAFKVFATTDVVVTRAQSGVETILILGVNYTVALNPDQDAAPGGTVTLSVALAVGQSLTITSAVPALQQVTVTNGGGFFPAVFNGVFDRLTILVQQLAEIMSRAITVPITASGIVSLNIPVLPNAVIMWDPTGTFLTAQDNTAPNLPAQLGQSGKYLKTNGTTATWTDPFPAQAGNANKVLKTDGAGNLSWVGLSWDLLSVVVAANVATVDLDTTFDATYDEYVIMFEGVQPVTNNVILQMRVRQGGVYQTTSYGYAYDLLSSASATDQYANSNAVAVAVNLAPGVANSASQRVAGRVNLGAVNQAYIQAVDYDTRYSDQSGSIVRIVGVGAWTTNNSAITAVRFLFSSGNINAGTFRLYGIRKA